MAIADRINEMYNHVGDAYDILELAGTNLSNLFNENVEQGAIGSYVGNTYENSKEDSATRIRTVNLIQLDKTKSYTISVKSGYSFAIFTFNDEKKYYDGGHAIWSSNEITITNIPYIALSFKKSSEANIVPSEIDDIQVMLNEGTIALPYVKSVDKNLINLAPTWKERLLYFINNGTDVVWNNWDKVTGEGTTLTLNNTEEAPMKINLKGNTSQATTTGKNLLPSIETTNTQMETGVDYYGVTYFISVLPNTQYTLSCGNDTRGYQLREFTSDKEVIKTTGVVFGNAYTTTSTTRYIKFRTNNVISSFTNTDFQFEKGSKTSYEPYTGGIPAPNPDYPQDIHVVSGDNSIVVCGKNLYYTDSQTKTFTSSAGSWKYLDGAAGADYSNPDNTLYKAYVENGKTYTFTCSITASASISSALMYYNNTTIQAASGTNLTYNKTFTASKTGYIIMRYYVNNGITVSISNVQLELSSTATTYEPYIGNTYPVNLPVENLFDKDNANTIDCLVNGMNRTIASFNGCKTLYIPIESSKTYTISKILSARFVVGTCVSTPANGVACSVVGQNSTGTSITITSGASDKFLCVFYYLSGTDTLTEQQILDSIQIEEGSKANSFTPYGTTPIELCKIGDYQDSIKKSTGKNLYNASTSETGIISQSDGTTITPDSSTIHSDYIEVVSSNYIASSSGGSILTIRLFYYDENKNYLSTTTTNGTFIPITNAKYIRVQFNTMYNSNFMLEKGSSATEYEPYGNGDWYLNKQIGKVVLNGSEDWYNAGGNAPFGLVLTDGLLTTSDYNPPLIYCDKFYKISQKASWSAYDSMISTNNLSTATNVLRFRYISISDLNDWETWLSTHNTEVYYVLATPTYTEITDSTLISQLNALARSYLGQTNISQNNDDLPFIINATALREME